MGEARRAAFALLAALALAGCGADSAEAEEGGAATAEAGEIVEAEGREATGRAEAGGFVAQAAIVETGESFACTPTKVWDGDGPIHCAEGPRIRLSGIAARETDGTCRPGHPCPAASAEQARDTLAGLLGRTIGTAPQGHLLIAGPVLTCRSVGSAGGKRTAAWCVSPVAGDLSCAMVASGTAAKWGRYWKGHACA
ncbi:MAG TPA: hypothetical protein VGC35_08405 [Allosphingosinicella sp.]|jgi:hypothetical protein